MPMPDVIWNNMVYAMSVANEFATAAPAPAKPNTNMKKHYLIKASRGIVVGCATQNGLGHWSFLPFTSAHGGSRKAHLTKEAAALRYSSPSCRWIEAESAPAAAKVVNDARAAYDRNEPCSTCQHHDSTGACARGAAPDFARNLGHCAKHEDKVIDPGMSVPEPSLCDKCSHASNLPGGSVTVGTATYAQRYCNAKHIGIHMGGFAVCDKYSAATENRS